MGEPPESATNFRDKTLEATSRRDHSQKRKVSTMPSEEITRFWASTRAQLDTIPADAISEPVESMSDLYIFTYRVILTSFGGQRIRAWFTVPNAVPPEVGWPAVMVIPGYRGYIVLPNYLARFGYATLSLYPRAQGESLEESQLEHSTRLTYHVTDKESYYYRGAFMDCIRGLDFLESRPEVDSSRIAVWGFSQGGGMTLATASLDHRPKAAVAGVPWLSNFRLAAEVTEHPYVELYNYLRDHPEDRAKAMETLAYFDQLNLADGIECPTLVCSAITDQVHPHQTIMPVFDKIKALKSIVIYHDTDHGFAVDFDYHGLNWLQRYLV